MNYETKVWKRTIECGLLCGPVSMIMFKYQTIWLLFQSLSNIDIKQGSNKMNKQMNSKGNVQVRQQIILAQKNPPN